MTSLKPRRTVAHLLLATLAAVPASAQAGDPKAEFVQALGRFSLALGGSYGDEAERIQSALQSMARSLAQWDAQIETYEAAMAADLAAAPPQLAARMHGALGAVYLDRGRVDDALREFDAALRVEPGRPDIHTFRGLAYSQVLDDQPAAADAFRAAATLDPRDPVRAYVLARHLIAAGEMDDATKALLRFRESWNEHRARSNATAVEFPFARVALVPERSGVEPFFPPVLYAEGFSSLQKREYERALTLFTQAAARDPLTAAPGVETGALRRAAAAFRDGSVPSALQHLETATSLAPDRSEPHRIRGLVYAADGQYDEGVNALKNAVRLRPDDERARLALADVLIESGELETAAQTLLETVTVLPGSGHARYKLARLYQRQGKYAEALREFEAAVGFKPFLGLNGILDQMGALMAAQQNFDGAVDAYSRRIDVHPNDPAAHYDLGNIYFRQGRHHEAIAEFAVVLMLNPTHGDALAALARLHLMDGNYDEAIESARRALQVDPRHMEAQYALATSLVRLGKTEEGTRELQVFQQLQAEDAAEGVRQFQLAGLRREAEMSSAAGDHRKAVELLRQVLALDQNSPASHIAVAVALVDDGQHAEAIEHFETALRLNAHFDVHRQLAEAYTAIGRAAESAEHQLLYERLKQEQLRREGATR